MSARRMYRYVVPINDESHVIALCSDPVGVAASIDTWSVEFWAEYIVNVPQVNRAFRVFGTGHPLPEGARWVGTCPRVAGLVWHLYEVPGE